MHGTLALAQFAHPLDRLSHLTLRCAQRTQEKLLGASCDGGVDADEDESAMADGADVVGPTGLELGRVQAL